MSGLKKFLGGKKKSSGKLNDPRKGSINSSTGSIPGLTKSTSNINISTSPIGQLGGYEVKEKDLTKLLKAAWQGDITKLKSISGKKTNWNEHDKYHRTALHLASSRAYTEVLEYLLSVGANVNVSDGEGKTPLMKACEISATKAVEVLLKGGAQTNVFDVNHVSPMHIASVIGNVEIGYLLYDRDAKIDAKDKNQITPLHLSCGLGHKSFAEFLISEYVAVDCVDNQKRTPLMAACIDGHIDVVQLLLSNNADVNIVDKDGYTAEQLALANDNSNIAGLFAEQAQKLTQQPLSPAVISNQSRNSIAAELFSPTAQSLNEMFSSPGSSNHGSAIGGVFGGPVVNAGGNDFDKSEDSKSEDLGDNSWNDTDTESEVEKKPTGLNLSAMIMKKNVEEDDNNNNNITSTSKIPLRSPSHLSPTASTQPIEKTGSNQPIEKAGSDSQPIAKLGKNSKIPVKSPEHKTTTNSPPNSSTNVEDGKNLSKVPVANPKKEKLKQNVEPIESTKKDLGMSWADDFSSDSESDWGDEGGDSIENDFLTGVLPSKSKSTKASELPVKKISKSTEDNKPGASKEDQKDHADGEAILKVPPPPPPDIEFSGDLSDSDDDDASFSDLPLSDFNPSTNKDASKDLLGNKTSLKGIKEGNTLEEILEGDDSKWDSSGGSNLSVSVPLSTASEAEDINTTKKSKQDSPVNHTKEKNEMKETMKSGLQSSMNEGDDDWASSNDDDSLPGSNATGTGPMNISEVNKDSTKPMSDNEKQKAEQNLNQNKLITKTSKTSPKDPKDPKGKPTMLSMEPDEEESDWDSEASSETGEERLNPRTPEPISDFEPSSSEGEESDKNNFGFDFENPAKESKEDTQPLTNKNLTAVISPRGNEFKDSLDELDYEDDLDEQLLQQITTTNKIVSPQVKLPTGIAKDKDKNQPSSLRKKQLDGLGLDIGSSLSSISDPECIIADEVHQDDQRKISKSSASDSKNPNSKKKTYDALGLLDSDDNGESHDFETESESDWEIERRKSKEESKLGRDKQEEVSTGNKIDSTSVQSTNQDIEEQEARRLAHEQQLASKIEGELRDEIMDDIDDVVFSSDDDDFSLSENNTEQNVDDAEYKQSMNIPTSKDIKSYSSTDEVSLNNKDKDNSSLNNKDVDNNGSVKVRSESVDSVQSNTNKSNQDKSHRDKIDHQMEDHSHIVFDESDLPTSNADVSVSEENNKSEESDFDSDSEIFSENDSHKDNSFLNIELKEDKSTDKNLQLIDETTVDTTSKETKQVNNNVTTSRLKDDAIKSKLVDILAKAKSASKVPPLINEATPIVKSTNEISSPGRLVKEQEEIISPQLEIQVESSPYKKKIDFENESFNKSPGKHQQIELNEQEEKLVEAIKKKEAVEREVEKKKEELRLEEEEHLQKVKQEENERKERQSKQEEEWLKNLKEKEKQSEDKLKRIENERLMKLEKEEERRLQQIEIEAEKRRQKVLTEENEKLTALVVEQEARKKKLKEVEANAKLKLDQEIKEKEIYLEKLENERLEKMKSEEEHLKLKLKEDIRQNKVNEENEMKRISSLTESEHEKIRKIKEEHERTLEEIKIKEESELKKIEELHKNILKEKEKELEEFETQNELKKRDKEAELLEIEKANNAKRLQIEKELEEIQRKTERKKEELDGILQQEKEKHYENLKSDEIAKLNDIESRAKEREAELVKLSEEKELEILQNAEKRQQKLEEEIVKKEKELNKRLQESENEKKEILEKEEMKIIEKLNQQEELNKSLEELKIEEGLLKERIENEKHDLMQRLKQEEEQMKSKIEEDRKLNKLNIEEKEREIEEEMNARKRLQEDEILKKLEKIENDRLKELEAKHQKQQIEFQEKVKQMEKEREKEFTNKEKEIVAKITKETKLKMNKDNEEIQMKRFQELEDESRKKQEVLKREIKELKENLKNTEVSKKVLKNLPVEELIISNKQHAVESAPSLRMDDDVFEEIQQADIMNSLNTSPQVKFNNSDTYFSPNDRSAYDHRLPSSSTVNDIVKNRSNALRKIDQLQNTLRKEQNTPSANRRSSSPDNFVVVDLDKTGKNPILNELRQRDFHRSNDFDNYFKASSTPLAASNRTYGQETSYVDELQEELYETRRQLDLYRDKLSNQELVKREMKSNIDDMHRTIESLNNSQNQKEKSKLDTDLQLSSLRYKLDQEIDARNMSERLCNQLKDQLNRCEKKLSREAESRQTIELSNRKLQSDLKAKDQSLIKLQAEINEYQINLEAEKESKALQEELYQEQLRQHESVLQEAQKTFHHHAQAVSKLEALNETRREVETTSDTLKMELARIKGELTRALSQLDETKSSSDSKLNKLQDKYDKVKTDLDISDKNLFQLQYQFENEKAKKEGEIEKLNMTLDNEINSRKRSEEEIISLRSRLEHSNREMEKVSNEKCQRESDLMDLKEIKAKDKYELEKEIILIKEQLQKSEEKLQDTVKALSTVKEELNRACNIIAEKKDETSVAYKDVHESKISIQCLKDDLSKEKEHNNILNGKVITGEERIKLLQLEVEKLQKEIIHAKEQYMMRDRSAVEKHDEINGHVMSIKDQFQKNLGDTKMTLSNVESSNQTLLKENDILTKEKFELQSQIEEMMKKINNIEREKQKLELDRASTLRELDKTKEINNETNQRLFKRTTDIDSMRNENLELQDTLQDVKKDNVVVESTLREEKVKADVLLQELKGANEARESLEKLLSNVKLNNVSLEEKLHSEQLNRTQREREVEEHKGLWESEVKSRSKLGLKMMEKDKLIEQLKVDADDEKRKTRRAMELKKSLENKIEIFEQRSSQHQKETSALRNKLKQYQKRLKDYEQGQSRIPALHAEFDKEREAMRMNVGKLRQQLDKLSLQLSHEQTKRTDAEKINRDQMQETTELKTQQKIHAYEQDKLLNKCRSLETEIDKQKIYYERNFISQDEIEDFKKALETKTRLDLNKKLQEVNMHLEEQALAREAFDKLRNEKESKSKKELEETIHELKYQLNEVRTSLHEGFAKRDTKEVEAKRFKELFQSERDAKDRLSDRLAKTTERLSLERSRTNYLFDETINKSKVTKRLFDETYDKDRLSLSPRTRVDDLHPSSFHGAAKLWSTPATARSHQSPERDYLYLKRHANLLT